MSTWFDETVACPSCAHEQTAKLAHGVHVSRAPEAREQILDRRFHRITCASCGQRFVAKRPLVYTDMDRKHWVHVGMADERPRWPEIERVATRVFEGAFVGSPLAAGLRDGFKLRLVFGVEELREKLELWRAGLDDRIVECAKLQMRKLDPELMLAHRLLVERVGDDGAELVVLDADDRLQRTTLIPRDLLDRSQEDFDQLQRYLPELFEHPFVSWHRLAGHRYR